MPRQSLISLLAVSLVGLLAVGCESRTDKNQTGGVALSISDFDGLPVSASVNSTRFIQVESITIQSVAKDPFGAVSDLMNVELTSYEVRYTRADTGTRLPPPMVRGHLGTVPVNGTSTVNNLPVMDSEALLSEPLTDLLFENGAVDRETGENFIRLNFNIEFFGRTLSGDEVRSGPAAFTIEMVP